MTHRSRKLLDLCRESPCQLKLANACSETVGPCHSDMLEDGRGVGHKSHDCLAVPGCAACHALFTRASLGNNNYHYYHARALKKFIVWAWDSGKVILA